MGVLDDPEASSLLLSSCGLAVQGQVDYHALLLLGRVLGHHGSPGVACQAVGVGLAVGPIQHHGPGVGHATGTWQGLGERERERQRERERERERGREAEREREM